MTSRGFRHDINGMRAIAVVGVTAFHFRLGPLRAGGFSGVDIFFVISGFLMTQIITSRLDRGEFSFAAFLQARVRRIFPAFVAMVIGVLVAGVLLLNPIAMERLAFRAVWALTFLSNWLFATQDTYFNAANLNWLLHTWSLSVEAQFYILLPFVLLGMHKSKFPHKQAAILFLMILSLYLMIWIQEKDSGSWSFYMLWTRAWEFLAGCLPVYASSRFRFGPLMQLALHYIGIALIFFTMFFVHVPTSWPSLVTAVPVLGSVAMITADYRSPGWALASPTAWLGRRSYSLYLWHWPVAAALSLFGFWTINFRLIGIAVSLVFAEISYQLIETKLTAFIWHRPARAWKVGISTFLMAFAFSMTLSFAVDLIEILRFGLHPILLAKLKDFRAAPNDYASSSDEVIIRSPFITECRFGKSKSDGTLVVGDSFAGELMPRYQSSSLPGKEYTVAFVTKAGCAPLPQTKRIDSSTACEQWQNELFPYLLKSDFKRIVFVDMWSSYRQGAICLVAETNCGLSLAPLEFGAAIDRLYLRLSEIWKQLRLQGKKVIVFDTIPYPGPRGDPLNLYERVASGEALEETSFPYDDFVKTWGLESERLRRATAYAGAAFVSTASLCPNGRCAVIRDGRPLYLDAYHLRASTMKEQRFSIFDRYIVP